MASPRIIFLHIPKTAGQSVHEFITGLHQPEEICPARLNPQLFAMTIQELRRYRLFSGHLDWNALDCLEGPRFVFTVLREPVERILSFYFYLRDKAANTAPEVLATPGHEGMKAVLNLPVDEYFACKEPGLRNFLDNHYDNFYTFFFAGRHYAARQQLRSSQAVEKSLNDKRFVEMALDNLSCLDGVYTMSQLDLLQRDLEAVTGRHNPVITLKNFRLNARDGDRRNRREELVRLGATAITFQRIAQMTRLDRQLWEALTRRHEAAPAALA